RTGGTFLSQQVGPASGFELIEELTGPLPPQDRERRRPEQAALDAAAAGLTVVDLRSARLRIELFDVAAVVWLLRRLVWWVPGFTVAGYRDRLEALHRRIERDGPFVAHSTRFLIEARRSA
ncbi:MAG TPA: SAM-dependent methyltransferase, partial [Actinotalea sp.]|nr:SAM-dependent methyltransferase [Actinotalea sp.]